MLHKVLNVGLYDGGVASKKTSILEVIFNLKKHLHNFLQLVILVSFNKFKCKIKELKS